jgi:hypothetical protein
LGLLVCGPGCGGPGTSEPGAPAESASKRGLATSPDPTQTVTIFVHGWDLSGASKMDGVVGEDADGGGAADGIRQFSGLPSGVTNPTAPNQVVATEYYGAMYPPYYSASDVAAVSALEGIPRYALIIAKYAAYVMARSGATGFNLTCHSMGCLISRYLIENDVGQLISQGKLQRWVSYSGVVDGAKLADLDHGEWLDPLAKLFGINLIDVQDMSYDWVTTYVAVYDHDRPDGNNPNFGGVLIHHILSTDPKIEPPYNIPLMDALGYGNVPNDGVLLDDEMYLHAQQNSARYKTPSGDLLVGSRSHHFANHFTITDTVSAQAMAAAAITGSRRVLVTLSNITLIKDQDNPILTKPPAAVAIESTVTYPYLSAMEPSNPLLDEVTMERRNAPVLQLTQGVPQSPALVLFEGPVYDAQTSVALTVNAVETDWYLPGGVSKTVLGSNVTLGSFSGEVPLSAGDYTVTTAAATFTVHVDVETLY